MQKYTLKLNDFLFFALKLNISGGVSLLTEHKKLQASPLIKL